MKHKFYDEDIYTVEDLIFSDNMDVCYLKFAERGCEEGPGGITIHKYDVIALAQYFGLVVYEKGSALEVKNGQT